MLHLACVVIAPLADPPPSSELSRGLARIARPYIQAVALDNGYRFFAPDPGPSHLVRYELHNADGSQRSHEFPNRQEHFPRLLYHRHFMLSETVSAIAGPYTEEPPEGFLSETDRRDFYKAKGRGMILARSVAQYLLRCNPEVGRVRLFTVTHMIPILPDVRNGMKLDDRRLYNEVLLGEFTRGDL